MTGCAGFIGSNLLETLLRLGQTVIGWITSPPAIKGNLDEVRQLVGDAAWARFTFIKGDIRDADACARAVNGVDYVLHQAALGSVPRSLDDQTTTTISTAFCAC